MPKIPPDSLIASIHRKLAHLLTENPTATSSEAYMRIHLEYELLQEDVAPRYCLRIGINYHGQKVQELQLDTRGKLIGWNPMGDALGTGHRAKMLLAGVTIREREIDEHMMSDSKISGGDIPAGTFIRIEFKARGWLGQTKNLDGKQWEKDIDLLKEDKADLVVACLSETAHRKWRNEGPEHHALRRTGISRFSPILVDIDVLPGTDTLRREIEFEGQRWMISTQKVVGSQVSVMPDAIHIVTMIWRLS